jgi:hypothetical protein
MQNPNFHGTMNQAREVNEDLAAGRPISPDLLKLYTPESGSAQRQKEALDVAMEWGLKGKRRDAFVDAYVHNRNISPFVPDAAKSYTARSLDIQQQAERAREELYLRQIEAAYGKQLSEQQKEVLENFRSLKMLQGLDKNLVSDSMLQTAAEEVARSMGMSVTKTPTLWERVFGGDPTNVHYTPPTTTPQDTGMIHQFSTGGTPSAEGGTAAPAGGTTPPPAAQAGPGFKDGRWVGTPDRPVWLGPPKPGDAGTEMVKQGAGAVARALTPPTTGEAAADPMLRGLHSIGGAISRLAGGGRTAAAPAATAVAPTAAAVKRAAQGTLKPSDKVGPNGESVDMLHQLGWTDSDIEQSMRERGLL